MRKCGKWESCKAKFNCDGFGTVSVKWAKYGPRKCTEYKKRMKGKDNAPMA